MRGSVEYSQATEQVHCDNKECTNISLVRLRGTMPRNWYGVWVRELGTTVRCCSYECLKKTRTKKRQPRKIHRV